MFFGIDIEKIVIIAVVAALLLGPEKLPHYAELLAKFTVRARDWLNGARSRVREEMGEEFDEIEWRKLDPRQYDPRRIIRDALLEDSPPTPASASPSRESTRSPAPSAPIKTPTPDPVGGSAPAVERAVPFDSEAT